MTNPRVQGRCLHQLVDVLALLLCSALAGCYDLLEICDYGRAQLAFLRTELGLPFANGIPSEDTLERLPQRLNPKELEQTLRARAGSLARRQLCVNGKENRATTPAGQLRASESTTVVLPKS
ncbi:transposase family protein [Hymenobacter elongatus]|uniref:transposase family protein n=1 Tax=Hymenobacter elongatus TaxID=877208 RepID=UPI0014367EDE